MGPLESLLRLDQVAGGVQSGRPRWGPPFTAHTRTRTDTFVEPYIIHLIYRKYIYLYYTQAVMLQEGPGHPDKGCGHQGKGSVTSRDSARRWPDQPILSYSWEKCSPFVLLRESTGSWAKIGEPPSGNKWGLLVTWGKPGTPQVSEDQESPGKVRAGSGPVSW